MKEILKIAKIYTIKKFLCFEAESLLNIIIGEIDGNEDEWIGKRKMIKSIYYINQSIRDNFVSKSSFRIAVTSDQEEGKRSKC